MSWLKTHGKMLAVIAGAAVALWIVYRIFKDIEAGVTTAAKVLTSPFTAISSAVSGIFSTIGSAFSGGTFNDPNLTTQQNAALNSAANAEVKANGVPLGTQIASGAPADLSNAFGLDTATLGGGYTMPAGGGY